MIGLFRETLHLLKTSEGNRQLLGSWDMQTNATPHHLRTVKLESPDLMQGFVICELERACSVMHTCIIWVLCFDSGIANAQILTSCHQLLDAGTIAGS